MPPVHRFHEGTIEVPFVLVTAIDNVFAVTDGCCEDYGLYESESLALERVCTVPKLGRTTVPLDAAALSAARNVLDTWTLSSECESTAEVHRVGLDCDFCQWCRSLVLRDWCDELFDRAGFPSPPYIDATSESSDVEADFNAIMAACDAAYAAAQRSA